MRILIKWPTRGRPDLFRESFLTWQKRLSTNHEVTFMITIDHNDTTMNNQAMAGFLSNHRNTQWVVGSSRNKIDAFNRDLDMAPAFDLLIVAQDDVLPEPFAFDDLAANALASLYPDGDGALHFNEGYQNENLCTMVIMGKKLFDRFGYIYHPDYVSLWADNEYHEQCLAWGKITHIPEILLRHNWHDIHDAMREYTESFKSADHQTFLKRKAAGFPQESILKQG